MGREEQEKSAEGSMENYRVSLQISLPGGGIEAETVTDMYLTTMLASDLDQTAWNMCDCNDERQAREFTNPVLEEHSVQAVPDGNMEVRAVFRVSGSNPSFIEKVVGEYMNGFPDWMDGTIREYQSHEGVKLSLNQQPIDWEVQLSR